MNNFPDWKKCTDELPRVSGDYLVVYEWEHPETSWFDARYTSWHENKPDCHITHWMELPPPPSKD